MQFIDIEKLFNELKSVNELKGKISLLDKDCIELNFNEFLSMLASDEKQEIYYGKGQKRYTHCHIVDYDELKDFILNIANGNIIFVEDKRIISLKMFSLLQPWNIKTISLKKFNNKKDRLMKKKHLRIYSGNKIYKD